MIIQQLKEGKNFTHQEQSVVDYILAHGDVVLDKPAKELAVLTFTSPATIHRLCRKIGFNSFHEFQLQYAKEYALIDKVNKSELDYNTSNIEIATIVDHLYQETITQTKHMLKKEVLNRVINQLVHVKRVDLYASDMNFIRVQGLCLRLNSLGINAQAFNASNNFYIETLKPEGNVSIVVSHTGNNPAMVQAALELRRQNIFTVAITNNVEKELELLCNESLYLYHGDYELTSLQYGVSLDYLLDIIYACLVVRIKS